MPRGGYRPGGGRPKGSKDSKPRVVKPRAKLGPKLDAAGPPGETPMAYMQRILNDPTADVVRRDRMAIQLASLQIRLGETPPIGKRERAQRAAFDVVPEGWAELVNREPIDWGDDLVVSPPKQKANGQ